MARGLTVHGAASHVVSLRAVRPNPRRARGRPTAHRRLAPQDLQRLYANRLAHGSAPLTVAHLHAVLHRALSQAERWGVVTRNVAALVDPPRSVRRTVKTLDP